MKQSKTVLILFALFVLILTAQGQTGGNFTITKSVVASGSQQSSGGAFSLDNTIGQSFAGTNSTGGSFAANGGFWQNDFAPTAASVSVGGRVTTAFAMGIRNVIVTMTTLSGETRMTRTSSFGYFRFDNITVGEVYVFSVSAKRFTFSQSSMIVSIVDERDDINFIAND